MVLVRWVYRGFKDKTSLSLRRDKLIPAIDPRIGLPNHLNDKKNRGMIKSIRKLLKVNFLDCWDSED